MAWTAPLALLLLAAVIPAWWLARRGTGGVAAHPLWFLVAPGAVGSRRRRAPRSRLLAVAAVAALALAAAGPLAVDDRGARVAVVDRSAARARDLHEVRARLAAFDEVVLVAPGAPPVRMPAAVAAGELVPAAGTADEADLAAGIAAAAPGASSVEVLGAPTPGADLGIAGAAYRRDPLASRRGVIVATVVGAPAAIVVRDAGGTELGRLAAPRGAVAIPYRGDGGELVTVAVEPSGDELPANDAAVVEIPALAPIPVWIDPALAGSPLARALAVLPTVTIVDAPRGDAVAAVASTAWRGPARARLVATPTTGGTHEPLFAVPGAPLPGATPTLLAAAPAVDVDPAVGADVDPSRVWLRAGPHAALFVTGADLRIAARLDGAVLPVVLADVFAAPPLAPAPRCRVVSGGPGVAGVSAGEPCLITHADVRAPAAAPARRGGGGRGDPWPARLLIGLAALLLAAEVIASRPRGAALALRALLIAGLAVLASRATVREGRRVVFVVDVSASVPAEAARAELARRAAALGPDDRAAVVVVAGGARVERPLGEPALAGRADLGAGGLDPGRTDLGAGLAAAGAVLGDGPGEIVVIGDGRDSEQGAAALRRAPAIVGRHVELAAIDDGDLARVELPATSLPVAPGRPFALPVVVETRLDAGVAIEVRAGGALLASRTVRVAGGRTALTVSVVAPADAATLDVAIAVPGDPVTATDRARVVVTTAGAPRVLRAGGGDVALLAPAALRDVDAVVLDDVAGPALPAAAAAALAELVADGGTLLWSAGPAVAAGGAGALEPLLPLRAVADRPVAMLLIVDRSGSIAAGARRGAVPDAAALLATASALAPGDRFGAIAFDVAPVDWIPLAEVGAGVRVDAVPGAGGGTDPTGALDLARDRLADAPSAATRIAVLVSDGGFPDAAERAEQAARRLAGAGIRLEVIAVGEPDGDARARLAAIAAAGGGALHDVGAAGLAGAVPPLRVEAAAPGPAPARARAAWIDAPAALRDGRALATVVARSPSADAVVLADAGDAPLLAIRPHGAGRVLAWTADLGGAWVDRAIAGAVVAAASAPRVGAHLELTAGPRPRTIAISLAADVAAATAIVTDSRGDRHRVALAPDGPGRWAAVAAADPGPITVAAAGARATIVVPDPEHAGLGVDRTLAGLATVAPSPPPHRVAPWLPVAAAGAIIFLLAALARGAVSPTPRFPDRAPGSRPDGEPMALISGAKKR